MAAADGGNYPAALLRGAAAAAAAAATLQPTPTQPQPGVQASPPAHLQLQQHPQQIGQQQHLGAQAAVALPFVPGLAPLGAAGAFPPGLAQLQAFAVPGQAQQQAAPFVYLLPPGAAPTTAGAAAGGGGAEDPIYVNPRQLAGILRRRKQREKEEAKRRLQPRTAVKKVGEGVGAAPGREGACRVGWVGIRCIGLLAGVAFWAQGCSDSSGRSSCLPGIPHPSRITHRAPGNTLGCRDTCWF